MGSEMCIRDRQYPMDFDLRKEIEGGLREFCKDFDLQEMRFLPMKTREIKDDLGTIISTSVRREELIELNYLIRLRKDTSITNFTSATRGIEGMHDVRIKFEKAPRSL